MWVEEESLAVALVMNLARDDGSLDLDGGYKSGKKWSNSGCIFGCEAGSIYWHTVKGLNNSGSFYNRMIGMSLHCLNSEFSSSLHPHPHRYTQSFIG